MAHAQSRLPLKRSLSVAISSAVAGVPAIGAQELEEIVVTATKRSTSLQDVSIAVTAFSEEDIVFQRFRNFDDYAGQIPSLSISDRQPGAKSVIMRGCAAQGLAFADSATTSIYLDEQPITSSGFNPDPRLIDVERVEALAGPQGTLFGDAAQCGTLRIITNKPDTTATSGWLDLSGYALTDGDGGYDVSAMVNVPLVEDKLALRLVGFSADDGGWIDNILSPTPGRTGDNADRVKDDVNSSTWEGLRGMLRFNPNEQWTIDLGAIYQKSTLDGFGDAELNQQFFADTSVFPTFGPREQARFSEDSWEDEWYQLSLTAEGNFDFGQIVFSAAYFDRDSQYSADATAYHSSFQERGDYFRAYDPSISIYDFGGDPLSTDFNDAQTSVKSIELRYATPAEGRWSAIVGGFYSQREVSSIFISNIENFSETEGFRYINYNGYVYYGVPLTPSGATNNWFSGSYDAELEQWAVFGEANFDVTEKFTITAGGRYYDISNDYLNLRGTLIGVNGGAPDCAVNYCYGIAEPGEGDDSGFVPKLSLTYRFNDDKMIYTTFSEGFRRGGANSGRPQSVYGPRGRFPEPAGTLGEYEADTVTNIEIGAKTDWADGKFRLNGAIYRLLWDDIQIQANDPQPSINTFGIINFPEAEIVGVELWASWLPTQNLSLEATLGYNDGELSKDAAIFPGTDAELFAAEGTRLPIVPDIKASMNATYNFDTELFGGTPYVFASYNYTGDSINSLAGIESNEFASPIREQDSWSTLNLMTGIETETWALSFYINNVTDEKAELFFNNRFNQQRLSTNSPRSYGVSLRYAFGGE